MAETPRMLSVSGLRGIVGRSLTDAVAHRYASTIGQWLKQTVGKAAPEVVIGRDSRPSGPAFADAAARGLASVGCRVRQLGVLSTPGVGVMVEHLGADAGLIITASHNPQPWNGIKLLGPDAAAPNAELANQIIERFKADGHTTPPVADGPASAEVVAGSAEVHVRRVVDRIDPCAIADALAGKRIVVDLVNGAGGREVGLLLEAIGCAAVMLHEQPTGEFAHTPEPTAENLTGLCAAVKEHGAVIGFAVDPDADRLALVDDQGRYIGEEYTLAIAAREAFAQRADDAPAVAATNLSTSRMIDDVARQAGATVVRSAVGEANVVAAMRDNQAIIGGEGNGGVIWPCIGYVRNSLAGIALVLSHLARTNLPLSGVVGQLPAYTIVKDKLPIRPGMADRAIAQLATRFADARLDRQDGLRIDLPHGWLHVRPSNTEPILRIIAEAGSPDAARELTNQARDIIEGR